MTKIQYNKRQYTITIGPEHIKRMGWEKGTEIYITKDPGKEVLYIEEMPKIRGVAKNGGK